MNEEKNKNNNIDNSELPKLKETKNNATKSKKKKNSNQRSNSSLKEDVTTNKAAKNNDLKKEANINKTSNNKNKQNKKVNNGNSNNKNKQNIKKANNNNKVKEKTLEIKENKQDKTNSSQVIAADNKVQAKSKRTANYKKNIKSPKEKKEVIKETTKKIPKEKIIIKDNNAAKDKNYKNELKDINNNKEFAKAIWDTDDITEAIKIEEDNQDKLNTEIDELLKKEKKYNFIEPFIIIILIILCFLGLYFILFTKDSAIINGALTNINNNLTNSLSELNSIKEELNKCITGTATLDTTNDEYANLKYFTYNFSLYNKNNNYYGNIELVKEDKSINNTYSYLDKNLYISTPLYYYPIQIDNPIKVNPLSVNYSNLNNNIEVIKNYLINNIKFTSSTKGKEVLNEVKVNVLTLNFDEYDFNNSIKSVLDAIGNDYELIKSIAKNIGLDEVTVSDLVSQNISFEGNYQVKIYTKGFLQTFVGLSIYNDDKEILEYVTDGGTTLNIYSKNKISINLSDDKLLIYVDDIKLIDIKSNKNKNDLINLDFQVSNILNNYQGSLVLTKLDSNTGSFLFSFKDTNNNDVNVEIKMDLNFGDNKENEFDYTDAVLVNDITDDEIEDIKSNLFNAIWEQVTSPDSNIDNETNIN